MSINSNPAFDEAMMGIYEAAKRECRYNATYFLRMLLELGGLETAQRLLGSSADEISQGLVRLYECKRLDISMEALILRPEWQSLFTDQERDVARERLAMLGYLPDKNAT